jgi:hypothetical protein
VKRPRLPKLGVQLVGKHFLRFIIANDLQEYYTDSSEWSPNRRDALLYAHIELVRFDLRRLKRNRRKPQ